MQHGGSGIQRATVARLCRFPVKGLSAEELSSVQLSPDTGVPGDRAFALARATTDFDEASPRPLDKGRFLQLRNNERLATVTTRLESQVGILLVSLNGRDILSADLNADKGRQSVEEFFGELVGQAGDRRPRLVRARNHKFTDAGILSRELLWAVSVINLATVRALASSVGAVVDPLRFRANIYIDGLPPWSELNWVGKSVRIAGVKCVGLLRTNRCGAINVDPATGARDNSLLIGLKKNFGHLEFGVYVGILGSGAVGVGDDIVVGD